MDSLIKFKQILCEDDDNPTLNDTQLLAILNRHGGITDDAVYEGFLLKAQCDGCTLADGTRVESSRDYWLTMAKNYRKSHTGTYPAATDCRYL